MYFYIEMLSEITIKLYFIGSYVDAHTFTHLFHELILEFKSKYHFIIYFI